MNWYLFAIGVVAFAALLYWLVDRVLPPDLPEEKDPMQPPGLRNKRFRTGGIAHDATGHYWKPGSPPHGLPLSGLESLAEHYKNIPYKKVVPNGDVPQRRKEKDRQEFMEGFEKLTDRVHQNYVEDIGMEQEVMRLETSMPKQFTVPVEDIVDMLKKHIDTLTAEVQAKQATIDALMLEYCPDEMTAEQLEEWKRKQIPILTEHYIGGEKI